MAFVVARLDANPAFVVAVATTKGFLQCVVCGFWITTRADRHALPANSTVCREYRATKFAACSRYF